jgi:hypothetical protein
LYGPIVGIVHDACEPLHVVPPEGVSDAQLRAIDQGIGLWNDGGETHLVRDPPGAFSLTSSAASGTVPIAFDLSGPFSLGLYDPRVGIVSINGGLEDPTALSITVAHELGHSMSLPHVNPDTRPSVMNPANVVVTPTAEDQAALIAAWGDCRKK